MNGLLCSGSSGGVGGDERRAGRSGESLVWCMAVAVQTHPVHAMITSRFSRTAPSYIITIIIVIIISLLTLCINLTNNNILRFFFPFICLFIMRVRY